jgi:hypothetical protein
LQIPLRFARAVVRNQRENTGGTDGQDAKIGTGNLSGKLFGPKFLQKQNGDVGAEEQKEANDKDGPYGNNRGQHNRYQHACSDGKQRLRVFHAPLYQFLDRP